MDSYKEVHAKEFQANMFGTCFNQCVSSFATANLNANEGKCLKSCFGNYAKKLETAGKAMGHDCKLQYNFD